MPPVTAWHRLFERAQTGTPGSYMEGQCVGRSHRWKREVAVPDRVHPMFSINYDPTATQRATAFLTVAAAYESGNPAPLLLLQATISWFTENLGHHESGALYVIAEPVANADAQPILTEWKQVYPGLGGNTETAPPEWLAELSVTRQYHERAIQWLRTRGPALLCMLSDTEQGPYAPSQLSTILEWTERHPPERV